MQYGSRVSAFTLLWVCTAALSTFSAGRAMTQLNSTEQVLLNHTVQDGAGAALTYFWITGEACVSAALIRMYVDDEAVPSLVFEAAKAAGLSVLNTSHPQTSDLPPFGTQWLGSLGRNAYYVRRPFLFSL